MPRSRVGINGPLSGTSGGSRTTLIHWGNDMRRAPALLAAASAAALFIGPLAAMAGAATPVSGVGTGSVSSTVLDVQLGSNGDILGVRVLGDDGLSTIDPAKGAPVSSETFRSLTITSKTVPALAVAVPTVATSS